MDSNPTRVRYAQNKRAFVDVIGDPFALPEPIEGEYYRLKRRTAIKTFNIDDAGSATARAAQPNKMDFFCDVDNAVGEVVTNKVLLERFWRTYLDDEPALNQAQRNELEQRIGRKFVVRRISPVREYFKTIRRKLGETRVATPLQG